jgi:adenine-specific DNA-methyltransferase
VFDKIDSYVAKELGYSDKREALKNVNEHLFMQLVSDFALKNKEHVFRLTAINDDAAAEAVALREQSKLNPEAIFSLERPDNYTLYVTKAQEIAFYSKKVREIDGDITPSMQLTNMWTDISYEGIAKEGGVKLKGGKKPERLIRRIVEMASNPGDIVLDFFSGSGTTASVAYKMGRIFITCDQLETQIDMSMKRLKNVAKGEQTGISKLVNWQGGGSFVYCELAKANDEFVEKIQTATTTETLKVIWTQMKDTGYLNYKTDIATIDANAADFGALNIDDQKRFLIECLDKNLLYVPLNDIDSDEYAISDEDKRLTKEFYKKN